MMDVVNYKSIVKLKNREAKHWDNDRILRSIGSLIIDNHRI